MISTNGLRKASLALSLLFPSIVAFAAPPQLGTNYNYAGWQVNNGVIDTTASCTAPGVTSCRILSQDNGFLQEEVLLDNGQHFIRLIMTEADVSGDPSLSGAAANLEFASEGFTPFLTNQDCNAIAGSLPNNFQDCQGLALKQDIRDLAAGFESTAVVQRNFAKSVEPNLADQFNIELAQSIDEIDPFTGLQFNTGFNYTEYAYWECSISGSCNGGVQIGKKTALSSTIFLDPFDATKKQEFRQIDKSGWQGRQSGGFFASGPVVDTHGVTETAFLGGRTVNAVTTGAATTFSWNSSGASGGGAKVANAIKSTWIASNVVDGFDYQSLQLTKPGTGTVADKQLLLDFQGLNGNLLDPFAWTASMGAQPQF